MGRILPFLELSISRLPFEVGREIRLKILLYLRFTYEKIILR